MRPLGIALFEALPPFVQVSVPNDFMDKRVFEFRKGWVTLKIQDLVINKKC